MAAIEQQKRRERENELATEAYHEQRRVDHFLGAFDAWEKHGKIIAFLDVVAERIRQIDGDAELAAAQTAVPAVSRQTRADSADILFRPDTMPRTTITARARNAMNREDKLSMTIFGLTTAALAATVAVSVARSIPHA